MTRRLGPSTVKPHSRVVGEYRYSDSRHVGTAPARVRRAVAEHATSMRDQYPKESDVIEHQSRLKRRHVPVRDLFQMAPHVLAALKPCWAMSPLVVSQLLPAQSSVRRGDLRRGLPSHARRTRWEP